MLPVVTMLHAVSAVAGDALTSVSVATDPSADARVIAWRLEGSVLILQGRAALGESAVLQAPRAPFHVLRRLSSTVFRLRHTSGGAGAASVAAAVSGGVLGDSSALGGDALLGGLGRGGLGGLTSLGLGAGEGDVL